MTFFSKNHSSRNRQRIDTFPWKKKKRARGYLIGTPHRKKWHPITIFDFFGCSKKTSILLKKKDTKKRVFLTFFFEVVGGGSKISRGLLTFVFLVEDFEFSLYVPVYRTPPPPPVDGFLLDCSWIPPHRVAGFFGWKPRRKRVLKPRLNLAHVFLDFLSRFV